jgi:hypothetical protein
MHSEIRIVLYAWNYVSDIAITGKRLELYESKLSFGQLAALRFASDEELNTLVDRSVNENLSPRQIKNSIVHWLPDQMRV